MSLFNSNNNSGLNSGFGIGGATSAPAGGSLFNTTNTTQPATTSLFGTSASTTSAPAGGLGGGLFGLGGAGNAANTSAPPANSLFGTTPAAQPAAQTGSVQQPGADGSNAQTAYFNSLLEKNRKRARDSDKSGLAGVPSLQLGLGDISRRVRELAAGAQSKTKDQEADSRAHYLLAASGVNPGTALKDLNSFSAAPGTQARLPPDFEPDTYKYAGQLQQRTTQKMIQEGLERANRAFDAFVEDRTSIDWEGQRKKIYEHFGLTPNRGADAGASIGGGFGRASRRAAEGQKGGSTAGRSIFSQTGMQKSVIGAPDRNAPLFGLSGENATGGNNADTGYLRQKQADFATTVTRVNEARLTTESHPILHDFQAVEKRDGGNAQGRIQLAYGALMEMVGEPAAPANPRETHKGPKARQFAPDYLDDQQGSLRSVAMRRRILDGSRKSLEKQYHQNVLNVVDKNPREARQGGAVGVVSKMRAYVRIRHAHNELLQSDKSFLQQINEDDYCWVMIFFLLRCGFIKEAMQYVRDNQVSFRAIDRNFITYLGSYYSSDDRRLPKQQAERISADYVQKVNYSHEDAVDPYRLACYKIIGRCQLTERTLNGIPSSVDDWIWLQFSLARESNRAEENAADVYGLAELQVTVKEIGQRHFGKGSDNSGGYSTFFYLQVLAGLFESAVYYLYEHAYVSAVHFAIALAYYGLLRVSDFTVSENELLTYTTREQAQISFGRMIGYYTRDFRTANPTAATDYLSLICLNSDVAEPIGSQQKHLCHEAIRELILETREFVMLLGDIQPFNGMRIMGAVEKRLQLLELSSTDEFLRKVTAQAATVADDAGRTSDAVVLYHLAEDYNQVVDILCRAVSETLASEDNFTPEGLPHPTAATKQPTGREEWSSMSLTTFDDPIALGKEIVKLYNDNPIYMSRIRSTSRDTLGVLLSISSVRDLVSAKDWHGALDRAADLQLLPLSARGNTSEVRHIANLVAGSVPVVSRLVGPLMLWVLYAISQFRMSLVSGEGFETAVREEQKRGLAVMTKDLMIFVGLVRLHMPRAIWDELGMYNGEFGPEWGVI